MTWLIVVVALALATGVALFLRREVTHWQEGEPGFKLLAPLRVVNGVILILLILLLAGGLLFAIPQPGAHEAPSPVMAAYWVFIGLLTLALMLLAMLDVMLVRRGFQRRQEEALREALLGGVHTARCPQGEGPDADRPL